MCYHYLHLIGELIKAIAGKWQKWIQTQVSDFRIYACKSLDSTALWDQYLLMYWRCTWSTIEWKKLWEYLQQESNLGGILYTSIVKSKIEHIRQYLWWDYGTIFFLSFIQWISWGTKNDLKCYSSSTNVYNQKRTLKNKLKKHLELVNIMDRWFETVFSFFLFFNLNPS